MTGIIALYIFMLAAFTGYEIIAKVPVILHTPLMSGSNFVHGIVLVGAMVALGGAVTPLEKIIGFVGDQPQWLCRRFAEPEHYSSSSTIGASPFRRLIFAPQADSLPSRFSKPRSR